MTDPVAPTPPAPKTYTGGGVQGSISAAAAAALLANDTTVNSRPTLFGSIYNMIVANGVPLPTVDYAATSASIGGTAYNRPALSLIGYPDNQANMLAAIWRRQLDDGDRTGSRRLQRSAGSDLRFGHEGCRLRRSLGKTANIDAGGVTSRRTPGDNTLEIAIEAAPDMNTPDGQLEFISRLVHELFHFDVGHLGAGGDLIDASTGIAGNMGSPDGREGDGGRELRQPAQDHDRTRRQGRRPWRG